MSLVARASSSLPHLQVSRDMAAAFKADATAQAAMPAGLDAHVRILTAGFWPSYPVVHARLPAEIHAAQAAFEAHYKAKYSGRRLQWYSALETCSLRARYPDPKGGGKASVKEFQARS